ncbi:MAG: lamin tail domain-containing protein, partial [Candidatus Hydrogenedentota bacterium]
MLPLFSLHLPTAYAGATSDWFVDFSNPGLEDGTLLKPYNTLTEALANATVGQAIEMTTATSSHETPTITQQVTLVASGGAVTIGNLASPNGSGSTYEAMKITEIMFNPASGKAEYLELQNTSSSSIDMTGVYFSDGFTYAFTDCRDGPSIVGAGARIVLVRDVDEITFIADYSGTTIFGTYVGNLDNGGERLAMNDPSHNTFFELTYSDGASWPDLADGVGFSMVIVDPYGDGSSGSNWRASDVDGGNPGDPDVDPNTPGIVVNEALVHVDPLVDEEIELYNPTGSPVDISGWFLSDDRKLPFKAKIPDDTIIQPLGYYVIDENEFSALPGTINGGTPLPGFLMSSHGEDVFLFANDGADNLTGYAHGWGFGGSENGVSFGREITSDGREHFVAQLSTTFGGVNAGPAIGPLVISKVHYHPLSNGVEFVEITNTSGGTVNLYDDAGGGDPSNTYKVSGIGFKFPLAQS